MESKIGSFIADHGEVFVLFLLTVGEFLLLWGFVALYPCSMYASDLEGVMLDAAVGAFAIGAFALFLIWIWKFLDIVIYFNLFPVFDRLMTLVTVAVFFYCVVGFFQYVFFQTSYTWLNQGTHISYSPSDDTYRIVKKDSYFVFLDHSGSAVYYNVKNDINSFILNNNLAMVDGNPQIAAVNVHGEKQETTTYIWGMSKQEAAKNEWNLFLILSPKSVSTTNTALVTFVNDAALKTLNLNLDSD